jgi:hypothetical protein
MLVMQADHKEGAVPTASASSAQSRGSYPRKCPSSPTKKARYSIIPKSPDGCRIPIHCIMIEKNILSRTGHGPVRSKLFFELFRNHRFRTASNPCFRRPPSSRKLSHQKAAASVRPRAGAVLVTNGHIAHGLAKTKAVRRRL